MANNDKNCIKMSGYLEKKGKMKMLSSWKSYWFVLEGRLLLYYRSKDEYDALSPCKGSISLSPTCTVKPLLGTSCVFQIETRVNTIVLKAKTRLVQDKWMHALLAALNQTSNTNGMLHFRYSSDELMPRRNIDDKSKFSRQYTLPQRLNVEKRHTFCRSFETLRPNLHEDNRNSKRKNNVKLNNDITFASSEQNINRKPVPSSRHLQNMMVDNDVYSTNNDANRILVQEKDSQNIMIDNEVYYTVSPQSTKEGEYIRKKLEKPEHIYERISTDSRLSNSFNTTDNEIYATTSDIETHFHQRNEATTNEICVDNDIYATKRESNNEDILIDNDQYCTPAIVVRDTNLVSYHEYNLPDKDKHIYSVPNFDNTDHNYNRISSQNEIDVNPYSVCQLYPKSRNYTAPSADSEGVYDNVPEYAVPDLPKDHEGNVSKLLQKFKKLSNPKDDEKRITKKASFLQRLFKKTHEKKKIPEIKTEEIEYAEINESVVKNMDIAYCIDKKLLAELELILHIKRQNLQTLIQKDKEQINDKENKEEYIQSVQPEAETSDKHNPKIPNKTRKKKNTNTRVAAVKDDDLNNFKSIDEILDELEDMKQNNSLNSGRVKQLIQKFDMSVKKETTSPSTSPVGNPSGEYDVILRRKFRNQKTIQENSTYNSNDELNRLLSELAKVTSAPILTPGVTNSLAVTSRIKDPEFVGIVCKNERRLSEPDYDIPRPHTNLQIYRDKDETDEDVLPATRFFGPVLPSYERKTPPPMCSMTPDSLELDISATTNSETSMPSYSSHKYEIRGKNTKHPLQRLAPKEEVYVDSLEPQDETSTIL